MHDSSTSTMARATQHINANKTFFEDRADHPEANSSHGLQNIKK